MALAHGVISGLWYVGIFHLVMCRHVQLNLNPPKYLIADRPATWNMYTDWMIVAVTGLLYWVYRLAQGTREYSREEVGGVEKLLSRLYTIILYKWIQQAVVSKASERSILIYIYICLPSCDVQQDRPAKSFQVNKFVWNWELKGTSLGNAMRSNSLLTKFSFNFLYGVDT